LEFAAALIHSGLQGHPDAPGFYRMSPKEPVLPNDYIIVNPNRIDAFDSPDLEAILKSVIGRGKQSVAGRPLLLVAHGTEATLSLPLVKGGKTYLRPEAVGALLHNRTGKTSDKDAAAICQLSVDALHRLQSVIDSFRDLRVGRLELRACLLGRDEDILADLRNLFGISGPVCAPVEFDMFGQFSAEISTDERRWDVWRGNDALIEFEPPQRIAYYFTGAGTRRAVHVLADSQNAVTKWVDLHFPGNRHAPGASAYFHAFLETIPRRPFFPNMPEYRGSLRSVPRLQ
jgi:hypothetical protein